MPGGALQAGLLKKAPAALQGIVKAILADCQAELRESKAGCNDEVKQEVKVEMQAKVDAKVYGTSNTTAADKAKEAVGPKAMQEIHDNLQYIMNITNQTQDSKGFDPLQPEGIDVMLQEISSDS